MAAHDSGDHHGGAAPHPHGGETPHSHSEGKQIRTPLHATLEIPRDVRADIIIHAFDENGARLCHCAAEDMTLEMDESMVGRHVTIAFEPRPAGASQRSVDPTLEQLTLRGVPVVSEPLISVRKGVDVGRIIFDPRLFKRSCCRVKGRVVRRITLGNGRVIERPLCNARLVICEVDASPRRIIKVIPDDLVIRVAEDLWELIRPRPLPEPRPPFPPEPPFPPPPPPPFRDRTPWTADALRAARGGVHADAERLGLVTQHADHTHIAEHPHGTAEHGHGERPAARAEVLRERVLTRATPTLLTNLLPHRQWLLENVKLLEKYWCAFSWLHTHYTTDCIKTVSLDASGHFDTDITYYCYGDRPDLYFKVEQGCNGLWTTVYAPSVACNTRWDYCCGTEIEIVVSGANLGLGPSLSDLVFAYDASDPASVGQWNMLPHTSEVFVLHGALMRSGKVLLFSGGSERQLPLEARVWDPKFDTLTAYPFSDDLFCAFQVTLGDGRVLVMGGSNYNGPHGRGILATYSFDPMSPGWTKHADMSFGRWYPTAVTLPNGDALVFSGNAANSGVVQDVEQFSVAANTWSTRPATARKLLAIYPSLHLMSSGKVFYTGTRWAGGSSSPRPWSPPPTALFDPATNVWTDVGAHVIPNRTEGISVLLPPRISAAHHHGHGEEVPPPGTLSRVVVLGGDGADPAERASAEVIDLADHAPAWTRIADMSHRRVNPNAVLLSDGSMVVCAGINGFKWDGNPGYVLESEILDTQSLTWRRAAVMSEGRQYHSLSILLPDGRVLNAGSVGGSGGGTNLVSMEVFSPPYLFRGPRPRITASPATATYGDRITLTSPDACRIRGIALMRPNAMTHHTDSEQRYLPVAFARSGRCNIEVEVPNDRNVLPPGPYMVIALDDAEIPSEGRFIHIS